MDVMMRKRYNLHDQQDGTVIENRTEKELIEIAQFMINEDPLTAEYFPDFDRSLAQSVEVLEFNEYKVSLNL